MFFVTSFKFVSSFEGITHSPGMKQQTRLIVQNEIATGVFLQETSLEKVALLLIYALVLVVTVLYTIDIAFQLVILMSVFGVEWVCRFAEGTIFFNWFDWESKSHLVIAIIKGSKTKLLCTLTRYAGTSHLVQVTSAFLGWSDFAQLVVVLGWCVHQVGFLQRQRLQHILGQCRACIFQTLMLLFLNLRHREVHGIRGHKLWAVASCVFTIQAQVVYFLSGCSFATKILILTPIKRFSSTELLLVVHSTVVDILIVASRSNIESILSLLQWWFERCWILRFTRIATVAQRYRAGQLEYILRNYYFCRFFMYSAVVTVVKAAATWLSSILCWN